MYGNALAVGRASVSRVRGAPGPSPGPPASRGVASGSTAGVGGAFGRAVRFCRPGRCVRGAGRGRPAPPPARASFLHRCRALRVARGDPRSAVVFPSLSSPPLSWRCGGFAAGARPWRPLSARPVGDQTCGRGGERVSAGGGRDASAGLVAIPGAVACRRVPSIPAFAPAGPCPLAGRRRRASWAGSARRRSRSVRYSVANVSRCLPVERSGCGARAVCPDPPRPAPASEPSEARSPGKGAMVRGSGARVRLGRRPTVA